MVNNFENHKFKKYLGQNFICNNEYVEKITRYLELSRTDNLIEIGPGDGRFSDTLASICNKLVLIEKDNELIPFLKKKFANHSNVSIINADILEIDVSDIFEEKFKIFGSLPYNISKMIIQNILTNEIRPEIMVFVIQKEVAQNYGAKPPDATFLSNYLQVYATIRTHDIIPRTDFFPTPKVDGQIIDIRPNSLISNYDPLEFIRFLKNSFANPRKKLINVLKVRYPQTNWSSLFDDLKINTNIRAQEIEFEVWKKLFLKCVS